MIQAFLKRNNFTTHETLGSLAIPELNFSCDTLELAWRDNENDVSCIPAGTYVCKWTRSNRLSKIKGFDVFTYEVLDVPLRAGIRIHSANFFYSLLGCIALGHDYSDMDHDGEIDILNSRLAIAEFNKVLDGRDFSLTVG